MAQGATIDFAAIEAEVGKLTPEEVREQLLKLKVRQIKQQGKQNPEAQKAYRQRKQAAFKAMIDLAKKNGTYDSIMQEAKAQATKELGDEAEVDTETVEA